MVPFIFINTEEEIVLHQPDLVITNMFSEHFFVNPWQLRASYWKNSPTPEHGSYGVKYIFPIKAPGITASHREASDNFLLLKFFAVARITSAGKLMPSILNSDFHSCCKIAKQVINLSIMLRFVKTSHCCLPVAVPHQKGLILRYHS